MTWSSYSASGNLSFINCKVGVDKGARLLGSGELNTRMHHEHLISVPDILSERKKYELFLLFLKFTEELPHTICFLGMNSNFLILAREPAALEE